MTAPATVKCRKCLSFIESQVQSVPGDIDKMLWPASPLYRYGILTATFLCVFIWSIWSPSTPEVVRSSLSNLKSHLHYDDSEQPHITQLPTTTKLPTHHVPSNHPTLINSAPVATATAEQKFPGEGLDKFEKPKDFKIIALVFFGRREYVQILDCYLQVSQSCRIVHISS